MPLRNDTIDTTLVKNTLGESSDDYKRLCTSARINMWSKHKPVRFNVSFPDLNTNWWKSSNRNCGINIPRINSTADIENSNWTYERPLGDDISPYRIGDFRGYEHKAFPILRSMYSGGIEVNKAAGDGKLSMIFDHALSTSYNLGIGDIDEPSLRDLYVCAELENSVGATSVTVTAPTPLGQGGDAIEIDVSNLAIGNYTMYLYLTSVKHEQGDATVPERMYALYQDAEHITKIPVEIKMYSPISFMVTEVGYSLRGPYIGAEQVSGFIKALRTEGEVCLKCQLSAKPGQGGGGYAVADMSARITETFARVPYTAGLFGRVFDESYNTVNRIEVSAGQTKTYYIFGNFLGVNANGGQFYPVPGIQIATGIDITGRGAFIGGLPLMAVSGRGGFIDAPPIEH